MKAKNGEGDDQLQEIFRSMPERFAAAKVGVGSSTQQEYLAFTASIDHDRYLEEEVLRRSETLFDPNTPVEAKKEILALLAHTGTLDAYRVLERLVETAEPELQDWSTLALQECRILLERDRDKPIGTILTGLGGEEDRLRYFFVVRSKGSTAFTNAQKATIEQGFSAICDRLCSVIEEVQVYADYATLKVLVPLDVAVGALIEGGISECNQWGDFLDDGYYVTNDRIPTEAEIQQFLDAKTK